MSERTRKIKELNRLEAQLLKQFQQPLTRRAEIEAELGGAGAELKALEIAYEQYFMGVTRFEPAKERQILTLRLRRLLGAHIPQTDLRFTLQNLSSRLQSFSAYWDRILRLIEEGRYQRQISHIKWATTSGGPPPAPAAAACDPLDKIYRELVTAHTSCQMPPPNRDQVAGFLERQSEAIRQRFGDRPVELVVVVESGKPKIKVRPRG